MKPYCLALFAVFFIGCLDPLVDDEIPEEILPSEISPPGVIVPSLYDDPVLNAQVASDDGVDGLVPLRSAFVNGQSVGYWDFGEVSATPASVWIFGNWDLETGVFHKSESHPVLLDAIPGDAGYSPICQVFTVELLPAYNGGQLTSPTALPEALALGYIGLSLPHPVYINCPVVHKGVLLDQGPGVEPLAPSIAYYRGLAVNYFNLSPPMKFDASVGAIPVNEMIVLHREGGEPLSEQIRQVDMTGDGDIVDSNNLFVLGVDDPGYTPLQYIVTAAVPATIASIDTYLDQTRSDVMNAHELFDFSTGTLAPISGAVIAFEEASETLYLPIRTETDPAAPLPVELPPQEEALK